MTIFNRTSLSLPPPPAALTCCTLFQPYPLNLTSYSGFNARSMTNHGSQLVVSFVPNGSVLPYLHAPYHYSPGTALCNIKALPVLYVLSPLFKIGACMAFQIQL